MNLEKSKKRIAKKVKMGFQGYPTLTIAYSGPTSTLATEVILTFQPEAGATIQIEKFKTQTDAREDALIQSAIVKMIERSAVQTVVQTGAVILHNSVC